MNNVTTILQLYKRPRGLATQIAAVKNQTVSSDLTILINSSNFEWAIPPKISCIHSSENLKYHFRFAIALLLQHPSRTLVDEEINALMTNLISALENELAIVMRE